MQGCAGGDRGGGGARGRQRTRCWQVLLAAALAAGASIARPAAAAVTAAEEGKPLWGFVSEARVGVLSHDIVFPGLHSLKAPNPFRHRYERGVNLNAEVIFVSPRFFRWIGAPRPRLGGSVNTVGQTSNVYLDLDWTYQFRAGPFLEGFFGGTWHDGKLYHANPTRIEFGSRMLFHVGGEVGWRLFGHHGVSLFWEHMSNSALAKRNQGADNMGLRYSYRFD